MSDEVKTNGLRCRPGGLARVIYSCNPALVGQEVIVEEWQPGLGRWRVCLLRGPAFGVGMLTGRPLFTAHYNFRDSSLEPLAPPAESNRAGSAQSPFPLSVMPG